MSEAIVLRGLERILIVATAALFGYLGYKLFLRGVTDDKAKVTFKSKIAQLTFSGAGPGLLFMAFGALVLLYALIFGSARSIEKPAGLSDQELKEIQAKLSAMAEATPAHAAEIMSLRKEIEATQHIIREQILQMKVPIEKQPTAVNAADIAALRSEIAELRTQIVQQR